MNPTTLSSSWCEAENRRLFEQAAGDMSHPRYHFVPPAMWMNDVIGALESDGWYHLFYLHDPLQANGLSPAVMPSGLIIPGENKPNRVWGHAVTRDFVHWEYLRPALTPRRDKGEIKVITGSCVVLPQGTPLILYTSVQEDGSKAGQWVALGDKAFMAFRQQGTEPVIRRCQADAPCLDAGFRDPFLFYQNEMLYAVVAGVYEEERGKRAGVLLYHAQSNDWHSWRYLGVLVSSPVADTPYYECPKLFPVYDRWMLVYSPYGPPRYLTGILDAEHCRFDIIHEGRVDETSKAYACVNLNGLNGQAYLMSWIPGWNSQKHPGQWWGGCLSIPRELFLDEQGALKQRPVHQVEALRAEPVQAHDGMLIQETGFYLSASSLHTGFRLEITSQQELAFCMELDETGVSVNGEHLAVKPGGDFQLYWDVCVWEAFLNDGLYCVTGMLDDPIQTPRLVLKGEDVLYFSAVGSGSCCFNQANGYNTY